MREEILKALIQPFAVISKQDGGVTEGERRYVLKLFEEQLDHVMKIIFLEIPIIIV